MTKIGFLFLFLTLNSLNTNNDTKYYKAFGSFNILVVESNTKIARQRQNIIDETLVLAIKFIKKNV